jgi:hypothetical protein
VNHLLSTGDFMAGKKNPKKVGSDPAALKKIGGRGDFGAPESNITAREYASQETKHADPGAAPIRMRSGDSARVSGVGANEGGPGSGSGGDIDPDIVGVGFNGDGLSQSGPDKSNNQERE